MLKTRFKSNSKLKTVEAKDNSRKEIMCMIMDGKSAQNTSSRMPENFNFLENTEERYARLNVIPGRMKRKRKSVETAKDTTRSVV